MASTNENRHVLVGGAHSMGALGVIRSLGRAGYVVHAAAPSPDALGLRSNFAKYRVVHPPPTDPCFGEWAEHYIRTYKIGLIIPGGGIGIGHPVFQHHAILFPMSQDPTILARARKYDLFEC